MAVITQNYDIDFKATGEYPVVKMSQFDTGSRTIMFTVYDGHELAKIDGCLARVDGTRSDGVEFSSTCTVSAGSKVSFTINQEMTKSAGKHSAELVLFDAEGNPIGTQNFMIEVEAAVMQRDSAVSADDRTLYDQYTGSIEQKFSDLSTGLANKANALNKTVEDISGLVGASSEPITIFDGSVAMTSTQDVDKLVITYDPITGLVHAWATGDVSILDQSTQTDFVLCEIPAKYCPDADYFNGTGVYYVFIDNMREITAGNSDPDNNFLAYYLVKKSDGACNLCFRLTLPISQHEAVYQISLNASWYARDGKYIGVSKIGTGGNTVTVGTTTTGEPGSQASVVNSGTAKDVVLDFTIPKGADGTGSSYTLPAATASTLGGVKIGSGISVASDGTISAAGLKGRWGSHVPFFGDSITAGYLSGGVTFRDVLSSTFGFEDHNYATGGEGFYRAGMSGGDIANEVANSKSDNSYDHSRVRLAVVCGGVNDVDRDVTKGRDGVRRVMEAIRGEYPNATILLASGLGGAFNSTYGRLDHRNVGYYDAIVSEGMDRGAMVVPDAFTWVGTDDTLLADGLHPNASGHHVIGAHLSNILAGLADPTAVTDASGQITKTADQDTLDAKFYVVGRSVRLHLHLLHILTDTDFDETVGGVRFVMCRTPNWLELPGYRTGAVLGFDGEYNTLNHHYWALSNGSARMVIRQFSGAIQMKTGMKLDIFISVDTVLA